MQEKLKLILLATAIATAFLASAQDPSYIGTSWGSLRVEAAEPPPTGVSAENAKTPEKQCVEAGCATKIDKSGGMVLNENKDELPPGCSTVREDVQITVRAGRKYAEDYSGTAFGFDNHEWRVEPCARITVRFINEDDIRHQWMVHGLPESVYPAGVFLIEVSGPRESTGSFIAPAEDKTYLVHCHLAQHMEKGMKGQLVVGAGSGDLSSIPGISGPLKSERKSWFGF